jgi:hypothetical protein
MDLLRDHDFRLALGEQWIPCAIKEQLSFVAPSATSESEKGATVEFKHAKLSEAVSVPTESLSKCCELLFAEGALPFLISSAVDAANTKIRNVMYSNVRLSGGSSALKGLSARLANELKSSCKEDFDIKVETADYITSLSKGLNIMSELVPGTYYSCTREERALKK